MKFFFVSLCILFSLVAIPVFNVEAQGLVTCSGTDCNFCDLADMTNNIINWSFGFLTACAVLVFAWAGVRLVTSGGDVSAMKFAKDRLTYVIIGFMLMLASWLIVDTILKTLTKDNQGLEIWGSFDVNDCGGIIEPAAPHDIDGLAEPDEITDLSNMLSSGNITSIPTVSTAGVYHPSSEVPADGQFTYQSGVAIQRSDASLELEMLLRCIASQVPANVGEISAISEKRIANNNTPAQWQSCWDGNCAHTAGSCHYGNGYGVIGKSYAVDFGDELNADDLIGAASACGAGYAGVHNGDHVHVSAEACRGN